MTHAAPPSAHSSPRPRTRPRAATALFTAHFIALAASCGGARDPYTNRTASTGVPRRASDSAGGYATRDGRTDTADYEMQSTAVAAAPATLEPPSAPPGMPMRDEGERIRSAPVANAAPARNLEMAAGAPASGAARPATPTNAPATPPRPGEARETHWQPAQASANSLRLSLGDRDTLPLSGLQVRTQIDGTRARVVLDAYFFNDRGRSLEGTFQLRLPDGASPYFFAFGETTYTAPDARQVSVPFFSSTEAQGAGLGPDDILRQRASSWNSPREARVVPRERAALAYTETVRQRVDPALMEWAGAGVFEARVFPLQSGRLHRIVVGYDVRLDARAESVALPLGLPGSAVPTVVDVSVAQTRGASVELDPPASLRAEGGYLRARLERPSASALTVRVRNPATLLTGSDEGGAAYFATTVAPTLPDEASPGSDHAVFVLDTSLSSQPEHFHQWLELLRATLERSPELRRFAVLTFDVAPRWWRDGFVPNTPENIRAFLDDANRYFLEGATDLDAALTEASSPRWALTGQSPQQWKTFLFSDGAATWGETDLRRTAARLRQARRGPLFAYRLAGTAGDGASLAQLTRSTGGSVFTLASPSELAALAVAHQRAPFELDEIRIPDATDVLIDGDPKVLYPGQVLHVVGRGSPRTASAATLRLSRNGRSFEVHVPLGGAVSSSLAPRAYGEVAVARLESLLPTAEAQSRAYASHFRVTGRSCSLVMLDSEDAYRRFGIVPADDASVVRTREASALVAQHTREAEESLADPRRAFLAWLERLPSTPGVHITVRDDLRAALAQAPTGAFELPREALTLPAPMQGDAPPAYVRQLTEDALDYDEVSREGDRRRQQGQLGLAVRALSSLVEKSPGDVVLARDVAFTTTEWGLPIASHTLLRRVQTVRPYEMHTYRSLAETAATLGRNELALAYYDLAWRGEWGARTQDFHTIAGVGYLRFLREIARGTRRVSFPELARARLEELNNAVTPARADVLVMIAWSTDSTDVDLHVIDPRGEECYFGHRNTAMGGFLTQDVTQGYGPEMFVLPQASSGAYRAFVHFYSSNRLRSSARTRVIATVVRGWGGAHESVTTRAITLGDRGDRQDIAQFTVP